MSMKSIIICVLIGVAAWACLALVLIDLSDDLFHLVDGMF